MPKDSSFLPKKSGTYRITVRYQDGKQEDVLAEFSPKKGFTKDGKTIQEELIRAWVIPLK